MRWLLFALVLAGAAGCGRPSSTDLRVLVTVEGLCVERLEPGDDAPGPAPELARAARAGRSCDGVVTSSTVPLAAVASVLTGLPAAEHGFVGPTHALRDRLPARLVTRVETLAARGVRAVAFVDGLPAHAGLQRGFAEFHVVPDAAAALAGLAELSSRGAADGAARFVWLHLRVDPDDARASPAWERSARLHLGPFAAADPELESRLASPDEARAYLGRRRGTPAWRALRRALYDTALAELDAALRPVLLRADGTRTLVLGVGGVEVDEAPPAAEHARFTEERLRALALLVGGAEEPGGADHALVSLEAAAGAIFGEAWPAPVERVAVATEVAGELCLVTRDTKWVRAGEGPVFGLARADDALVTAAPPDDLARALARPVVRGELTRVASDVARREGPVAGSQEAAGLPTLELRVADRPRGGARAGDGALELPLADLDAPLVLDLGLPPEAREADVQVAGLGRLDRVPLPRLPAPDGQRWARSGDPDADPTAEDWRVDVTRAAGGRVRVHVLSPEPARLRVVLTPAPLPAHRGAGWAAVSHGASPVEAWLDGAPGEAVFRGEGLDVSFATAGATPALVVELAGEVLPMEALRWSGRRFQGAARRYLLTARTRERLVAQGNLPASLPPAAPGGEDGARYRLDLTFPPAAPLPAPLVPTPVLLSHVPPSD